MEFKKPIFVIWKIFNFFIAYKIFPIHHKFILVIMHKMLTWIFYSPRVDNPSKTFIRSLQITNCNSWKKQALKKTGYHLNYERSLKVVPTLIKHEKKDKNVVARHSFRWTWINKMETTGYHGSSDSYGQTEGPFSSRENKISLCTYINIGC